MCLAVPGKIVTINGEEPLTKKGKVSFGGIMKEVSLAYVPEAKVGEYVIVHVGFAIAKVNEEEARLALKYFEEMGELEDLKEKDADGE